GPAPCCRAARPRGRPRAMPPLAARGAARRTRRQRRSGGTSEARAYSHEKRIVGGELDPVDGLIEGQLRKGVELRAPPEVPRDARAQVDRPLPAVLGLRIRPAVAPLRLVVDLQHQGDIAHRMANAA